MSCFKNVQISQGGFLNARTSGKWLDDIIFFCPVQSNAQVLESFFIQLNHVVNKTPSEKLFLKCPNFSQWRCLNAWTSAQW